MLNSCIWVKFLNPLTQKIKAFLCKWCKRIEIISIEILPKNKVVHSYAVILFRRVKSRTADWVNLRNLWTLRNCVRENYNHGIGMNDLIFGENFDGDNLDTLTPLTKKRFDFLCKRIKELDPYATI
ncbi:exo-poly-alpha-D-galacturonosidase [Bacteroides thetaiotaomicron]|uniref:exo-poly-alpha-D-galacturonosidase n=1 Tax=Bacteroides TaxID=816 RepID=UPI0039B5BED1